MSASPLGIFDSGVGGLSVLRPLRRILPCESVLYFADTANVPYGDKPVPVVRDLALGLTAALIGQNCKLVLMASGTSTVAGLQAAKDRFPTVPILGTIDAGASAAVAATDGPLGVLATNATARSRAFTEAVQALAPGRRVVEIGCPKFVPLVESGRAETPEAVTAACEYLEPLLAEGVQAVILGCTHFPFLMPSLLRALACLGPRTLPVFVDPAEAAVREARALLAGRALAAPLGRIPAISFAATGDPEAFAANAALLLGEPVGQVAALSLPTSL